jgi:VIT1/CCC1 family predicted Fe2+/Mn2+ transporter
MSSADAEAKAVQVIRDLRLDSAQETDAVDQHEEIGSARGAAFSSFCFFASGALIPVLPYLFGLQGVLAVAVSALVVGLALLGTGAVVGLLSGGPPLRRALRQLGIGFGAAAVTYGLGLLLGALAG